MATILHIDQDEAAQNFIQSILGQQFNVVSAADGPTAVQYCAMIQPDLILMHLASSNGGVGELSSRLKMFMPQTPILAIGDDTLAGPDTLVGADQLQDYETDIDDYLTKPIEADLLLQRVQSFLPKPEQLPEMTTLNQAYKRLASLNTVSALIGTSLDLEHLTDEIIAQIHKTIDFDSATLFLLKGDVLEAAASRGLSGFQRGMNTYRETEHNSAWRAVRHKLPLIINDVTRSEYWEPRPELSKIRSWLGVPLIYKDRVVGVLTLDKNEPNAFSDADARYAFTLAYQIAIAVENAQLFEEWEEQATRLKLINEVAQEINTHLDVDELFEALAKAIYERLNYDCVAILQVDETRSLLTLKAVAGGLLPQSKVGVYQQDINLGLIGEAIQTRRPILAHNLSQATDLICIEGFEIRAALIVPLSVGTQVEAVICVVVKDAADNLGDQDVWTLSSLASQAAIAVKNAWLYRSLDTYSDTLERTIAARTQRLQAIKKISQLVSQGLDIDELLLVVRQGIRQIFTSEPLDVIEDIQVTIGLRNGSEVTLNKVLPIKINPQLLIGQVVTQAKSRLLGNVNLDEVYYPVPETEVKTIASLLVAPLITGGKVIGLIMVESQTANAFDDSDLEILETVAFQVASAIEHARLLQKTREIAIVEERTRLARDMHDGIAQNLAYLLIQVDRGLNMVTESSKLEIQLEQISALLKQNIDELRRNIFDLRPVDLEGKSLFEVLERFVTEFGQRWNLKTTCTVQANAVEMSPDVERSLYRIFQEALSNARQHAQCTRLSVKLDVVDNQWVRLEIIDDGQGFDLDQVSQGRDKRGGKGLGLTSMRERAERVGGQFVVESDPQKGTRIFAKLPIRATATNFDKGGRTL